MNERETSYKGNTILLTIIGVATLLIAVVGATFAYFTAQITGDQETATTIKIQSGTLALQFVDGGTGIITIPNTENTNSALYPRDTAWVDKKFSMTATSSATTTIPYVLSIKVEQNGFTGNALTFDFDCINKNAVSTNDSIKFYAADKSTLSTTPITSREIATGGSTIPLVYSEFSSPTEYIDNLDGNQVKKGVATHEYQLKIYFKSSGNQNDDQNAVFAAYIKANQPYAAS